MCSAQGGCESKVGLETLLSNSLALDLLQTGEL